MITEDLISLKNIKDDIRNALIEVEAGDPGVRFEDYPEYIRNLEIASEDIYSQQFEKSDVQIEEYVVENNILYFCVYSTWKYKYSDDYIKRSIISKEEIDKDSLLLDVETTDGSEISISYTTYDDNTASVTTSNGKLYLRDFEQLFKIYPDNTLEEQRFNYNNNKITLTNWTDKVEVINYINTDLLPGYILEWHLNNDRGQSGYSYTIKRINKWVCKNARMLDNLCFHCDMLEYADFETSDKLISLVGFNYVYSCEDKLQYIHFSDTSNVGSISQLHENSNGELEEFDIDLQSCISANNTFGSQNLKRLYLNNTGNMCSFRCFTTDLYQLEEIYGLDYNSLGLKTKFYNNISEEYPPFEGNSSYTNWYVPPFLSYHTYYNLVKCKIDNLGKNVSELNHEYYPSNNVWCEEDIIYTFSNIYEQENGTAEVNEHVYTILEANSIIPIMNEKGWTVIQI